MWMICRRSRASTPPTCNSRITYTTPRPVTLGWLRRWRRVWRARSRTWLVRGHHILDSHRGAPPAFAFVGCFHERQHFDRFGRRNGDDRGLEEPDDLAQLARVLLTATPRRHPRGAEGLQPPPRTLRVSQ